MSSTATSQVGKYLDEAEFGREHYKLLSLVGGGGFFDSFDIYLAGSVLGTMVATKFSTVSLNASFISSTFAGLLIGTLIAGRVGDRYGRRVSYHVFATALWRRIDHYRGGGDALRGDRPARHRRPRPWCGYHHLLWNVERVLAAGEVVADGRLFSR